MHKSASSRDQKNREREQAFRWQEHACLLFVAATMDPPCDQSTCCSIVPLHTISFGLQKTWPQQSPRRQKCCDQIASLRWIPQRSGDNPKVIPTYLTRDCIVYVGTLAEPSGCWSQPRYSLSSKRISRRRASNTSKERIGTGFVHRHDRYRVGTRESKDECHEHVEVTKDRGLKTDTAHETNTRGPHRDDNSRFMMKQINTFQHTDPHKPRQSFS